MIEVPRPYTEEEWDTTTGSRKRTKPEDVAGEFCHLYWSGVSMTLSICGLTMLEDDDHGVWMGESLCDVCGLPICPRCRQIPTS